MSTVDSNLVSRVVASGKEERKEKIEAVAEEKKEHHNYLQPQSKSNAEPLFAPIQTGDLETAVSSQLLGRGSRSQELPEDLAEVLGDRAFEDEEELEAFLKEKLFSRRRTSETSQLCWVMTAKHITTCRVTK